MKNEKTEIDKAKNRRPEIDAHGMCVPYVQATRHIRKVGNPAGLLDSTIAPGVGDPVEVI